MIELTGLAVYLVGVCILSVLLGWLVSRNRVAKEAGEVGNIIPLVIVWPILLIGAIIVAPFFGLYKLGRMLGRK